VTSPDPLFRQRLIRRALHLRHATTAPPRPTWTREQIEQAAARNRRALAAALPAYRIDPHTPADPCLEDREAEP